MLKRSVKKLLVVVMYVLDWYKIPEICDKVILENGGMLTFVPDCYKIEKMCDKAVNYAHALEFVHDCYKTQEMCDKTVYTCFFVFDSVPDQYKIQEM